MNCFEDIIKTNNNFDSNFNTIINRFNKTNDSKILITESPNLAASYQISDGLIPLESWSFPQLNPLAFPLITGNDINDGIEYILAVQEPNSLTKWSFGDQKQKLEKHLFNSKIIGLIGFNAKPTKKRCFQPIVVFENGFCQTISNAIKTKTEENKQRIVSEEESIQFIDGLIDKKLKEIIIYLITKSKTSTDTTIKSIYKLTLCVETDQIVKNECQLVANRLTNWSLCHKTASILSVNYSDKELTLFSLNGESETNLFKLNSSLIKTVYCLGTTSGGSVCLIGETKNNNFSIELWELKYGSVLGRILLPYEPLINDCKVIDDMLFITCLKGIVLVPIKIQSISLSQIVGKNLNKELIIDSKLNQQLNQICEDLKSEQSLDEINERFKDIQQISGNISEDIILKLLIISSQQLRETNNESLKMFFGKLVSLPFNELFMISILKSFKLKFQQILSLLESLTDLLPSNNSSIIDWISLIIDSHMNQFIMNPNEDTIKSIEKIQLKIDTFCQFCEQLGQINTFFEIILSKKLHKSVVNRGSGLSKPQKGQYCMEILRI